MGQGYRSGNDQVNYMLSVQNNAKHRQEAKMILEGSLINVIRRKTGRADS